MRTRLTEDKVRNMRKHRAEGMSLKGLSEIYGITVWHVSRVVNRRCWNHVI